MSHQKLFNNYFSTYTSQTGGAVPAHTPVPAAVPAAAFDHVAWLQEQIRRKPKRGTPGQVYEVAKQSERKKSTGNIAAQAALAQSMGMSTLKNVPQPNYNRAVYLTNKDGNLQKRRLAVTGDGSVRPQRTLEELYAQQQR